MSAVITGALIQRIKAKGQTISKNEGNLVLLVMDLATDFVELQKMCKRKCLKELKALGYHPRISARYFQIGQSWWCSTVAPLESSLAQQLPYDLHKLEFLCRLPKSDLEELLKDIDPQKEGRSRVILAVQRRLGEMPKAAKAAKVTRDVILKKWEKYVSNTLDAIEELSDDTATDLVRQELAKEIEIKFFEIQDALSPSEEEDDSESSENNEVQQDAEQSQEVTPPAPAAPAAS